MCNEVFKANKNKLVDKQVKGFCNSICESNIASERSKQHNL